MDYFEVITDATTGQQTIRPYTPAEIAAVIAASIPTFEQQQAARAAAYTKESDPLFFKAQRGEATLEEWQTKVAEIKARFPYPEA
jgi:hypothetical protein